MEFRLGRVGDAGEDVGEPRLTASNAIGEIGGAFLLRRILAAMSANSKNLRRAWLQHRASRIGPGLRSGR